MLLCSLTGRRDVCLVAMILYIGEANVMLPSIIIFEALGDVSSATRQASRERARNIKAEIGIEGAAVIDILLISSVASFCRLKEKVCTFVVLLTDVVNVLCVAVHCARCCRKCCMRHMRKWRKPRERK